MAYFIVKTYHLKFEQYLPIPLAEAWNFFSSPGKLPQITPPHMKFVVTSEYDENTKIYPGMIITYKVAPLFGIKMNWMTEISHIKEHEYFIDDQRTGPYAVWHHEHHFREVKGGILMTDKITYAIPYGIIGRLANRLLVEKEIRNVFEYRKKEIVKLFGAFRQPE